MSVMSRINFRFNHKYSLEKMRSIANSHGGKCLSNSYEGSKKMLWKCSKGHKWLAISGHLVSGSWCPQCSKERVAGYKRLGIEQMRKDARKKGGKCLSDSYLNCRTKLKWECSEGHTWWAAPYCIRKGTWCPICARARGAK